MKQRSTFLVFIAVFVAGGMLATDASAQVYKYRDPATGKMIMTDKPPRGTTPRPSRQAAETEEDAPEANGETEKPKLSGTDPRLEARKREEEAQARAKQQAEAEELKERKRAFCADLARDIQALESGQRIVRMNEAGERVFLEDAERSRELEQRRAELARCEEE